MKCLKSAGFSQLFYDASLIPRSFTISWNDASPPGDKNQVTTELQRLGFGETTHSLA